MRAKMNMINFYSYYICACCSLLQVTLVKQEKVACLTDNEATLGLDPHNHYTVQVSLPTATAFATQWLCA